MKYLLGNVNGRDGTQMPLTVFDSLDALSEAHPEGAEGHFLVEGEVYIWDSEWKQTGLAMDALGDVTIDYQDADEPSVEVSTTKEKGKVDAAFTLKGVRKDFKGATSDSDGAKGLVPAPLAGDTSSILMGDGQWHPVSINMNDVPDTLSDMSWDSDIPELAAAAEKSPKKYASLVGMEKTFTTSGLGTFTAVVVDVCHFDRYEADGKAGLTFQFKETTSENYQMYTGNTNSGGYQSMVMHTTTMPGILAAMQSELRNAIVEVRFPYNHYKNVGQGDSAFGILETHAKLFPPSNREVWGTNPLNGTGAVSGQFLTGADGTQLAYWALHPTIPEHVKYKVGTDTAAPWWSRSCYPNNTDFITVAKTGPVGPFTAQSLSVAVAPLFNIGGR